MLSETLVVFAASFSAIWIVLFALAPNIVQVVEAEDLFPRPGASPDPVKCLIFAFCAGVIIGLVHFAFLQSFEPDRAELYTIQRELLRGSAE